MSDLFEHILPVLRRLLPSSARVLVGTSGGPDSQALLDLLARAKDQLGWQALWAVGIDHGLRAAALTELALARALAEQLGVPFAQRKVQLDARGNLLANARRARYQALRGFMNEVGATHLAVAHTASDQAETLLLHLARGCALRGAAGMRERRGFLVRPLLSVPRSQVMAHLQARGIVFATDPSNSDLKRARARLRAKVVPGLESLNERAIVHLAEFAKRARQDEQLLSRMATSLMKRSLGPLGSLRYEALRASPPALRLRALRSWLGRFALRADTRTLHRLDWAAAHGKNLAMGGRRIIGTRGHLWVDVPGQAYERELCVPGRTSVPEFDFCIKTRIEHLQPGQSWRNPSIAEQVAFDVENLHLPPWVRSVRHGDRVQPFGLAGTTKVGDLFTNAKIPRPLRSTWPLVVLNEEIAWVVGLKRSALAPVTNATRSILVIEVEGALPWSAC